MRVVWLASLASAAHVNVVGSLERGLHPMVRLGNDGELSLDAGRLVLADKKGSVAVSSDGILSNGLAAPVMTVSSVASRGVKQWRLADVDTFDAHDESAWSIATRTVCGANPDVFLGGPCKLGHETAERVYKLPPHSRVRVTARVHFFDEWAGESLYLKADGQTRWTRAHTWCSRVFSSTCTKYGLDTCGRDIPDKLSVPVKAEFAHTGDSLELIVGSTLAEGDACKASWGLDDVRIEIVS